MIISLIQISLLCFICYQDFRYRSVSALHFCFLIIISLIQGVINNHPGAFFLFLGINVTFLFFLISAVTIYFSLKNRKIINILDTYLGWGDVIFFISLCFMFSPVNFIIFFTTSLMISLVISGIIKLFRSKYQHIPLAGIMASLLIPVLTVSIIYKQACFSDVKIMSLITQIL